MPARKNRPGKHGAPVTQTASSTKIIFGGAGAIGGAGRELVDKLIRWEQAHPMIEHYVGWPDMDVAELLVKRGYLRESGLARGCFAVTEAFRQDFMRLS